MKKPNLKPIYIDKEKDIDLSEKKNVLVCAPSDVKTIFMCSDCRCYLQPTISKFKKIERKLCPDCAWKLAKKRQTEIVMCKETINRALTHHLNKLKEKRKAKINPAM